MLLSLNYQNVRNCETVSKDVSLPRVRESITLILFTILHDCDRAHAELKDLVAVSSLILNITRVRN